MVSFRRVVAGADINHWWDDGVNAIAFTRGNKGFVAINGGSATLATTVATGMAPGTYLDLLDSTAVVVDSSGAVQLNLPPKSAIAIDLTTKIP
jgi:alpha-amylase